MSLEKIVDAVIEDGIATFSMPSIATRLGVAHSGLYRYICDREELLILVLDKISRNATWPSDQPWRDQLASIGETYWTICDTHPGYDMAALGTDHVSRGFVEMMTLHVQAMHAQGFNLLEATDAIEFVANMTLNCSIAATRLRKVKDQAAAPEHSIGGFQDPDIRAGRARYQHHLDVHLDGLEVRLTRRGG